MRFEKEQGSLCDMQIKETDSRLINIKITNSLLNFVFNE